MLLLYLSGMTMFALLDGHDRLAAAVAEGLPAPLLVLWHPRETRRAVDPSLPAAHWDMVDQRQRARGEAISNAQEVARDNTLLRSGSVPRDRFTAVTRAEQLDDDDARWEERLQRGLGITNARSFLDDCR